MNEELDAAFREYQQIIVNLSAQCAGNASALARAMKRIKELEAQLTPKAENVVPIKDAPA